ncbi:MAG: hypothetical protein AMK69_28165 [Nitrospira bacterium SG8_3]|nr:MAG: hypothetical protein AMK69_28165 [Nitrospira bacterium SG8_3]
MDRAPQVYWNPKMKRFRVLLQTICRLTKKMAQGQERRHFSKVSHGPTPRQGLEAVSLRTTISNGVVVEAMLSAQPA